MAEPRRRPSPAVLLTRFAWVAALVVLDLWSKSAVFARMAPGGAAHIQYDAHGHPRELLLDDWLAFMTSLNPGMAWGFDGIPPYVLVCGRGAAVLLLVWLVARNSVRRRWMSVALILVLAGAIGNLHDNLFTSAEGRPFGKVRDFIDVYFPLWDWHFPTFNIADSCISVGAVLLFLASWKKEAPEAERARSHAA